MADGVFSQGKFVDGIAPQSVEGDALDLLVGSSMRIERKRFKELAVPYGIPATIRNRLDYVDVFWPAAPTGLIAYDAFPARDDSTLLPGGIYRGDFFHSQSIRRRAILARLGVAYLFRHDGDAPITAAHIGAAYEFVQQHKDDLDTEAQSSPLVSKGVVVDESISAYDEKLGIGVRIREA